MVKESVDLGMYLDRFERIMRECEVEADEWVEKLFARLNEKLCVRVNELRDEGAGYEVIKRALLKAVGETTITYGHRIFELTGEALKAKTGDEIVDEISRLQGVVSGCQNCGGVCVCSGNGNYQAGHSQWRPSVYGEQENWEYDEFKGVLV